MFMCLHIKLVGHMLMKCHTVSQLAVLKSALMENVWLVPTRAFSAGSLFSSLLQPPLMHIRGILEEND